MTNNIYVDTRERDPWRFEGKRIRIKKAALKTGDYTNSGMTVFIERKTVSDLFHTLTRNEARFCRELDRMGKYKAFKCIIVEGTAGEIIRGVWSSQASGSRVLDHFLRVCMEYRIAPIFARGRFEAEDIAYRLLSQVNKG